MLTKFSDNKCELKSGIQVSLTTTSSTPSTSTSCLAKTTSKLANYASFILSIYLYSTYFNHLLTYSKNKSQTIRRERKKPINQKTWIAYGHGYVNSLSLKSGTSHPHNSSSHSRFPNRVDTVAPPNQSNSERTGSPGQTRTNC